MISANCNTEIRTGLFLLATAFMLCLPAPVAADAAGKALAQKVYDRPDGRDASSRAIMVLKQKGHKPRYRKLFSYRLDKGRNEVWSLLRFTEPADIDGTGLLTLNLPGDETNQWIYLPALDRARRIASSRKGGRFVGSDFYYEDLQDREVEMDRHRIIGTGKVGKIKTKVLESIPVDPDNSVYSKRVSWIHPGTLIALRIDFYKAGREKPIKRLKVKKIKKIKNYWTVLDNTMYDLVSGHSTRLITKSIGYDQGLPEGLFTRRMLIDPERERRYRP